MALNPIPLGQIAADVLRGLSSTPKSLPPKLFYDARGSALFDRITTLPEYYPTRCEREILESRSREICDAAGHGLQIVELGPGDGSKAELLLRELSRRQLRIEYVPIDISHDALAAAAHRLASNLPKVRVAPLVADFSRNLPLPASRSRRLALYLGSSIGNLDHDDAAALLRRLRHSLSTGDKLLLGADLVKPEPILLAAYDDAAGVTAAFNKNLLARINRELEGNFDLDAFAHRALWNAAASRIEMHLESLRDQNVRVAAETFHFQRGETIHTENSHKYSIAAIRELLHGSGFWVERAWTDTRGWFSLHLASVA